MTGGAGPDVVTIFRESLDVLRRYPILVVPPLAVQVVVFVLTIVLLGGGLGMGLVVGGLLGGMPGGGMAGMAGMMAGGLLLMLLGLLLSFVASGLVIVMARDALASREPAIGSALEEVMARLLDVVLASLLLTGIVGLGLLFLILPGLAAAFFLVFALPAVMLEGVRPIDALGRSARLVRANPGPVAVLCIGGILVAVAGGLLSAVLGLVPVLGHLATLALSGALISYLSVVAVRVFLALPRS